MKTAPHPSHQWLQQLVGDWSYETEATMAPDQPPAKFHGTEHVRSLGDHWILAEGSGEMPGGGTATMLMTLGYNPPTQRFVGTWIGSMMSHLWIYDGELDAKGKVLILNTTGPNMAGDGAMAKYQDIIELKSNDHRTLTSRMQGEDGEWHQFMTAHYHRRH